MKLQGRRYNNVFIGKQDRCRDGGSSGIGLATAKGFVEEGAYVFIAGRRQSELDKAVAEIGSNVTGVKTDIAKLDDLGRFYEIVVKWIRRVTPCGLHPKY